MTSTARRFDRRSERSGVAERGADGAAMIELAIVVLILAMFLFGIIAFGITMSFKQVMVQAGNDAARAAAVAPSSPPGEAVTRAREIVNRRMAVEDTGCNDGRGLACSFVVAPCAGDADRRCMTIELVYDAGSRPRVTTIPGIDRVMPNELSTTVVVEVEG